ncbi:MAG TPA: Mut7-C RNAse domain-containing protein [Candidatus Polarisedimenticolia bacterium]|nr:Mut7-C RNAse domain-containing protein [Candidatus Polarisedimenticolia bacterium]
MSSRSHRNSKLTHAPEGVKEAPERFAADCMLGRLARWLRLLGHDVAYFRTIRDEELVDFARREGRRILTRDTRLVQRRAARDAILIHSHALEEQLEEMLPYLGGSLAFPAAGTRCTVCNKSMLVLDRALAKSRVPPYVFQTQASFLECPECRRVYWSATHVRGIRRRLRKVADPDEP